MKSSELKLGHAYKVAGKEGPAFYVNCHPHDGASHIMAWHDSEEDEEKFFLVDACEIEYEIPATTELVFDEQYEAFLLASRVLQNMPTISRTLRAVDNCVDILTRAKADDAPLIASQQQQIKKHVEELFTLFEDGVFREMTGADKHEAEMVELRRKASLLDKVIANGPMYRTMLDQDLLTK